MQLRNWFQTLDWALLQTFSQVIEFRRSMGSCNFRFILLIKVPKSQRGKVHVFDKNFQNRQTSITWNLVFTFPLRILLKPWTLLSKKDTNTAKTVSQFLCLKDCKKLIFTLLMKNLVFYSIVRTCDTFMVVMLANGFIVMSRGKGPHKLEFGWDIVHIHSLILYHFWIQFCSWHKSFTTAFSYFFSTLKVGDF